MRYILPQKEYADIVVRFHLRKPQNKGLKTTEENRLALELILSSDFFIDDLLRFLVEVPTLSCQQSYPQAHVQSVLLEGTISRQAIKSIMNRLGEDFRDYDLELDTLQHNYSGLIQLFVLYCLHDRLKKQVTSYE